MAVEYKVTVDWILTSFYWLTLKNKGRRFDGDRKCDALITFGEIIRSNVFPDVTILNR